MKKTLNVINNPRLDRIFSEAYRNTMKQVALREQDKHDSDYYGTFSDLFEKELYNRDLSSEERNEFMAAFHREIEALHRQEDVRHERQKKLFLVGGSSLLGVLALSFAMYIAIARPFMPTERIIQQLDYYQEKVEDGYGSYTRKFYGLLDQQGRKLTEGAGADYRVSMYQTLDQHFAETVTRLEAGEVRFFDDAKKWASRFPDAEERTDRKDQAENAFKKGVGAAIGNTLNEVKEGAKNIFQKAADFVRETVKGDE